MKKHYFLTGIVVVGLFFTGGVAYRFWEGPSSVSAKEAKPCQDSCEKDGHGAEESESHEDHNLKNEASHSENDGHHHENEKLVVLTEDQLKNFGIITGKAGPGKLQIHLDLPGEVTVDADRVAHLVPRVAGVVRQVHKSLGDSVKKGEVLAVFESRELADAKAGFLAAKERLTIAQANLTREEKLWQKKISAEQEYLQAKQALAEVKIELRSSEQKLHTLGFSEKDLANLPAQEHMDFTRYSLTAPFDATIIEKHLTLGEAVKDDSEVFTLADLSTVCVTFNLHQKDLPQVSVGQPVTIFGGQNGPFAQGTLLFVAPVINDQTRTTCVRAVLANPKGEWRPGLFVTGRILIQKTDVPILVDRESVLIIDGKPCVFIETSEGFEPKPVTLGRSNDQAYEILSGLTAGQTYAVKGAYTLKLELGKFKGDPCGGH